MPWPTRMPEESRTLPQSPADRTGNEPDLTVRVLKTQYPGILFNRAIDVLHDNAHLDQHFFSETCNSHKCSPYYG